MSIVIVISKKMADPGGVRKPLREEMPFAVDFGGFAQEEHFSLATPYWTIGPGVLRGYEMLTIQTVKRYETGVIVTTNWELKGGNLLPIEAQEPVTQPGEEGSVAVVLYKNDAALFKEFQGQAKVSDCAWSRLTEGAALETALKLFAIQPAMFSEAMKLLDTPGAIVTGLLTSGALTETAQSYGFLYGTDISTAEYDDLVAAVESGEHLCFVVPSLNDSYSGGMSFSGDRSDVEELSVLEFVTQVLSVAVSKAKEDAKEALFKMVSEHWTDGDNWPKAVTGINKLKRRMDALGI